jgi:hypothetical protein
MNQLLKFTGIHGEHTFAQLQGDLKARIPKDQLSMHKHISDPPMPAKANQWRTAGKVLIQELIQQYTMEGLKQMRYHILPPTRPVVMIQLILMRYKIELALKDLYRLVRKTT